MTRIKHLFAVGIIFLAAASFLLSSCSRYRDLPPGKGKEISSAGFKGIDVAGMQKLQSESGQPPSLALSAQVNALPILAEDQEFSILTPFGYDFFRNVPGAMTPGFSESTDKKSIPVPRQYPIGLDDQISVFLGNPVNKRYNLSVDGNGRIDIPGFGLVFVEGMTFKEMSGQVVSQIEKKSRIHVDISMNAPKTINVFVRGEVSRPVPHAVGAFATVTEALRIIGGPKETGTLRNIELRRKGITVASFDLYEYLLKGVRFRDVTLMEGDELFIPPKGPEVAIAGSVKRPAVYEMKDRNDLESLIALAGGVVAQTEALRIRVHRIDGNQRKIIYDIHAQEIGSKNSAPLFLLSGDIVRVAPFAGVSKMAASVVDETVQAPAKKEMRQEEATQQNVLSPESQKFVVLTGEFQNPGRYAIQKGEKLSSVIERAGGYTDHAYLRGAYFRRESVRQIQQKKLNEMVEKLTQQFFPSGVPGIAERKESGIANDLHGEKAVQLRFSEYIQSLEATGRLVISLAHLRLLKGSAHDIEMEQNDHLHLPQKSSMVNVIGSVMTEGPRVYDGRWDYREYISAAGGYAHSADKPNVFVIKVDGSTRKLSRGLVEWSHRKARWEITAFGPDINEIEAGDVIFVPERHGHIVWLRQIKDSTPLLMNTAALTGTALMLW